MLRRVGAVMVTRGEKGSTLRRGRDARRHPGRAGRARGRPDGRRRRLPRRASSTGCARGLPLETCAAHRQPARRARGRRGRHAERCAIDPAEFRARYAQAFGERAAVSRAAAAKAGGMRDLALAARRRLACRCRGCWRCYSDGAGLGARGVDAARGLRDPRRGLPALLVDGARRARHPAVARAPGARAGQRAARVRRRPALRHQGGGESEYAHYAIANMTGREPPADRPRLGGRGAARVLAGPRAAPRDSEPTTGSRCASCCSRRSTRS